MTPFLEQLRSKVEYDTRSVHYSRRKYDGLFEIVARAKVEDEWRTVALDIQPSRVKALDAVRFLRGHEGDNNK